MKKPSRQIRTTVYTIFDSNRCRWWKPSEITAAHAEKRATDPTLPPLTLHDVGQVLQWYASQGFAVASGHGSYQYRFQTPREERSLPPAPSTDMTTCI